MSVIAIDKFGIKLICSISLILITAAIANTGLAAKGNNLEMTAFALIKRKSVFNLTASNNLANFRIYDRADIVNFNKFIPVIFKNLL